MNKYLDTSFFANPLWEYLKWLKIKVYYQAKYWGKHLRIGYNSYIKRTTFGKQNSVGRNVFLVDSKIDDYTYLSNDSTITNTTIGRFCSIGPNVKFAPGRHPTSKFVSTHPIFFAQQTAIGISFTNKTVFDGNLPVTIGNDVWVGANSVIIDGVTIGDGAIIASNSVVTKDVGPYEIVGGVPAKLIRKKFNDDQIEKLLQIKWWYKDDEWLKNNVKEFEDVDDFVLKFL